MDIIPSTVNRFSGKNPFDDPRAQEFVKTSRWLKKTTKPPKVVVLENSEGVRKTCKAIGGPPPVDFIFHGVIEHEGGKKEKVGLKLLKRWVVLGPFYLSASGQGLAHLRMRFWVVLVRQDCYQELVTQKLEDSISRVRLLRPKQSFLEFAGDTLNAMVPMEDEVRPAKRLKHEALNNRRYYKNLDDSLPKLLELCKVLEIPGITSKAGRPFSTNASDLELHGSTPLQLATLDICASVMLKLHGEIPNDCIVDISQSAERKPWKIGGTIPTPCTSSMFYLLKHRRLLTPVTMFEIMGWPKEKLNLNGLSVHDARILVGQMMAVPCVGAVLAAVLTAVPLREELLPSAS